jgi:magnesium transporter
MKGTINQPELREWVANRDREALQQEFSDWQPSDVAELIDTFEDNPEDQVFFFNALPRELSNQTFEYLDISLQKHLLEVLSINEVGEILNEMAPDDRTSLLEELPSETVTQLLSLLTPEERTLALSLLEYPESSVGRLMTPYYIAVNENWTVRQVLDYIRRFGSDSETLNVIYVVDNRGHLIDDIRVREFLLNDPNMLVHDLMDENFQALNVTQDQEEAVALFKKNNRVALPVIDNLGRLLGIVTVDDVLEVAQEEDTEDIQKLGGVEALEDPYLNVPLTQMVRKRATWLVILFISEMLTATAMGYFQDEIAKAVVLALFVPLIISSGGNSGSQAATLIIRAMALGEVTLGDWWRVVRREFLSGLFLGGILGIIGFFRIALWSLFSDIYGPHWFLLGIVVSFSLLGVVMWGTLSGSMLPMILKRLGLDPATSSAPFVATLVDVTGLLIYFGLAAIVLSDVLL